MSFIAGTIGFGGAFLETATADHLTRGLTREQRQRCDVYRRGPIAMIAAPLAPSVDSGLSLLSSSDGDDAIVLDGRLDNRAELLCHHNLRGDIHGSDPELACAMLSQSGAPGLRLLLGEWSLAFWQGKTHRLYLASDYMGIRPLYYRRIPAGLCWSSDIVALLDLAPNALNTDYLLDELTIGCQPNITAYRDIFSVPSGCYLTVDLDGNIAVDEHSTFTYSTTTRVSRAEYVEELRRLMFEAVAVRLRTPRPVWISLSGGLDSSAIFSMADRLVSRRLAETEQLRTATFAARRSPELDETRFVKAVTDHTSWPRHFIDVEDYPIRVFSHASPQSASGHLMELCRLMAADGAESLLSGRLGDAVMGQFINYSCSLASHIPSLELFQFAAGAHRWAHAIRQTFWRTCAEGAFPALPQAWQRRINLRAALRRRRSQPGDSLTFADAFCLPDGLEERVRARFDSYEALCGKWPDPGRRHLLKSLYNYRNLRLLQTPPVTTGFRFAYPWAHRPLVTFSLSVPHDVMCRPGEPRAAMKAALDGIVPQRVLSRISKGYAQPAALRELRPQVTQLRQTRREPRVVQLGLIDPVKLAVRLDRMLAGSLTDIANVREIVDIEQWLGFIENDSKAANVKSGSLLQSA